LLGYREEVGMVISRIKAGRRRGFSLVEMLIVLAILAILSTLTISSMIGAKPNAELDKGQEEVSFLLNQARMLAVSEELNTRVVFQTNGEYWYEAQDRDTGTWSIATAGDGKSKLPTTVTLTGNTFPAQTVTFTPRGTLLVGGTLTFTNTQNKTATLVGNVATGRFPLGGGNTR
jgi:type II secretion system protein H